MSGAVHGMANCSRLMRVTHRGGIMRAMCGIILNDVMIECERTIRLVRR